MINFTTQTEYQGQNIDLLLIAGFNMGDEFCTYKQAINYFNLSGKELKGAKSCARLMTMVTKKVFDKLANKEIKKQLPYYFSVFEKKHLIDTMLSNGHIACYGEIKQSSKQ